MNSLVLDASSASSRIPDDEGADRINWRQITLLGSSTGTEVEHTLGEDERPILEPKHSFALIFRTVPHGGWRSNRHAAT